MHNAFFRREMPDCYYDLFPTTLPADVEKTLLTDPNVFGMSVTMPLKHAALGWCDEVSEHGKRIGAINTVWREGGKWRGENTDWLALRGVVERLADSSQRWAIVG